MSYYEVPRFCGIYYVPVINVPTPTCQWLPQVSLSTHCKLFDTSSRTTLAQTFVNPSKSDAIDKAKYNFPLYESCAVVAFRCYVGDRLIEGVAKGKEEAKEEYDTAVAKGETAGLLEQFTPDVFRTSLGNIPAGATVKVEVDYIMELKHDAEVDGLRFTIPTSIAPRYGTAPSDLGTDNYGKPIAGAIEKGGMKISVQITMPSNIRTVQSPSHPITIHLGGHLQNVADDAFNPKHAFATLGQTSTELGADFILLVKCADLSNPRALLENHSTKSRSKALMVTLVPKFTLPSGPKPEIVFIADRSGSMDGRMGPLKSALSVFLKSLPVGVKFNICSFGSAHSFLWSKSKAYSADTLEQAQKHVDSMEADMGGTEILPPIKATVSKRLKDLPLEIMVLTDGEVWDTESLFQFIEKETASGDVRLFSLGIGRDVSHSLVEGMARVGRGFAQIVSDEQEGIEGKVVRMLRGGLSAHVKDYRLEWEGRPTEEQAKSAAAKGKSPSALQRAVDGVKKKISLFDKQADPDPPISSAKSRADRFADLPESIVPSVLQAPYKVPPLFPFSRTTVYVIHTGDVTPPSSVWLRGTTPSGDDLELEIPVQVLPESGITIHQLAARKMLQELEEGNGYLHSGKYGVDKEKSPGKFEDWVEREGIRLGVEYGLASKWTSFVAVQKRKKEKKEAPEVQEEQGDDKEIKDADDEWMEIESVTEVGDGIPPYLAPMVDMQVSGLSYGGAPPVLAAASISSLPGGSGPRFKGKKVKHAASKSFAAPFALFSLASTAAPPPPAPVFMAPPPAPAPTTGAMSYPSGSAKLSATEMTTDISPAPDFEERTLTSEKSALKPTVLDEEIAEVSVSSPDDAEPAITAKEHAKALITLQSFEGSFSLTATFASTLGRSLADLEAKLKEFTLEGSDKLGDDDKKKLWATLLAISMFESKLRGERDMWELVVEKARNWVSSLSSIETKDVERLDKMANDLLAA